MSFTRPIRLLVGPLLFVIGCLGWTLREIVEITAIAGLFAGLSLGAYRGVTKFFADFYRFMTDFYNLPLTKSADFFSGRGIVSGGRIRLTEAPGQRLFALVDFLFSSSTVESTFKPIIADWRFEYFEALKQNRKSKARWISLRYRYQFIIAMSLSRVLSLLKEFRSVVK